MGVTIWLFNIAMENDPFIDGLPIKNDQRVIWVYGSWIEWMDFMGVTGNSWDFDGELPEGLRVNVYIDVENPWGNTLGKWATNDGF